MKFYRPAHLWKIYFAIASMLILIGSMIYTDYLADRLAEGERDKVQIFVNTLKVLSDTSRESLNRDLRYETENLRLVLRDIPVILVDEQGNISGVYNIRGDAEKALARMKKSDLPPIEGEGYAHRIYYSYSRTLTWLTYFPFVQMGILLVFFILALVSLSAARRAEQNRVWVGMAKETAHQLGTPISGIMGWIEYLKELQPGAPEYANVLKELERDVQKLELIADRFSKIGSAPELQVQPLKPILLEVTDYIRSRLPRQVTLHCDCDRFPDLTVRINKHLFEWVVENLLRNALDALKGKGSITIWVERVKNKAVIYIKDTGHGIPSGKFKTIFDPGYTTKKRGWGLGLSLAKRIIEDYHGGKIYVKESRLDEGTTFAVELPLVD